MVAEIETIRQMRQSGASLRQIGSHFGITREAVRRRLVKHYGSTRIQDDLLPIAELARLAGCSQKYIIKLKRQGAIQPAVIGRGRSLWKPETIATIIIYNDSHRCPVCHQPVPSNRSVYCSTGCYIEAGRYKNRPEAVRKRQRESTKRWVAAHPEQAKEIEQRKAKKRSAKKSEERYRTTQYIISRKCTIPLGTVVRVVSGNKGNGTLNVEWSDQILEIPLGCVRKLLTQGLTKG